MNSLFLYFIFFRCRGFVMGTAFKRKITKYDKGNDYNQFLDQN